MSQQANRPPAESSVSVPGGAACPEDVRTGLSVNALKHAVCQHLFYLQGRHPRNACLNDIYVAVACAVRDRLFQRGVLTVDTMLNEPGIKLVCYLSAEFLIGPQLGANLINLGIYDNMRQALTELDIDLDAIFEHEEEPGLGNGGLGRLAACYLDSLATLEVPAIGHGIRYEFGIFDQEIHNGWQVEVTDKWLRWGNPWEVDRPEYAVHVKFGGYTEPYRDAHGRFRVRWNPSHVVKGVPHDTPVLGYHVNNCNVLRLWQAEAVESFDFAAFNMGDYFRAVEEKAKSENISKVLYPNDESPQGKQLRLQQQYFFVSSALQDMLRIHLAFGGSLERFHEHWALQLNDTHPAIAVAELMRLLVDVHALDWDRAWDVTVKTTGFTNHTLLPEALERWSVPLFASLLPRHLEIIYEINRRLLDAVALRFPGDNARIARMSLIDESDHRYIRMANLACAGSHAINGVAPLHTDLLKRDVLHDWVELYPERFLCVTNGVTPRRFMLLANPPLADLLDEHIGTDWPRNLDDLTRLEPLAQQEDFRRKWRNVKYSNKDRLARLMHQRTGIAADPESLFDIQVKRIHEYKRQHLNVLHILSRYLRLKENPDLDIVPRTFIFGGKAAPGYDQAKLIIRLITATAELVNGDPDVRGRIKVVFFPDFNVKNGQEIYPAADLSEQISTAGKEASGTGNMKFALNGALTIGTLDGANVQIREHVGEENFFLFGLTADEVLQTRRRGYRPRALYERNVVLRGVLDLVASGRLAPDRPGLFHPLVDSFLRDDPFMLLADFDSYLEAQDRVDAAWRDRDAWTTMSILNTARMGYFSSDRSIREYCDHIWNVRPVPVDQYSLPQCGPVGNDVAPPL